MLAIRERPSKDLLDRLLGERLQHEHLRRESSAAFTSNDGFSVVAPMRTMSPASTRGRKASCCALLKR
jgi:hypothetical protein